MNSYSLDKSTSKEIDHVWASPLTIKYLQNIKNSGVLPLGVVEQFSIKEKEEHYIKRRVTRDCLLTGHSGLSVSNRVQIESLKPYYYCFCLLRILHMISATRNKWQKNGYLSGKRTWTHPTSGSTQMLQPCRLVYQ